MAVSSIFDKTYEDPNGIRYKLTSIKDGQFHLKVIDSPFSTIKEGLVEKRNQLPPYEYENGELTKVRSN